MVGKQKVKVKVNGKTIWITPKHKLSKPEENPLLIKSMQLLAKLNA